MGFPLILILAAVFWIFMSVVKYWYYSKTHIEYTHKLDPKILEEIRRPPKHVREKIMKMQEERAKNFDDNPEAIYSKHRKMHVDNEEGKFGNTDGSCAGEKKRPLTIFEEIDLLKEQQSNPKKKNPPKYDRSMFEDSLSRLHKDLQTEKKKRNAEIKLQKACNSST